MFIGLWQSCVIMAAIALVLLGLFLIPRRRRMIETLSGVNDAHDNGCDGQEVSYRHNDPQLPLSQHVAEYVAEAALIADCELLTDDKGADTHQETVCLDVAPIRRNLMLCSADLWHTGNATRLSDNVTPSFDDSISSLDNAISSLDEASIDPPSDMNCIAAPHDNPGLAMSSQSEDTDKIVLHETADFTPHDSLDNCHNSSGDEDGSDAKLGLVYPVSHDAEEDTEDEERVPVPVKFQETEGPREARLAFLNRLTASPFRLREGGSYMLNIEKYSRVQTACLKVEKVVGHGSKQVLLEETKTIAGIKIVEIIPTLINIRSIVKDGKVIIQGTVHKQIFYIGTDGLEHHLAEDIDFSELVDVEPLNPMCPVREGMNQQDFSVIENSVFEFDPDTGALTQKIILRLCVKVTETEQFQVATCPEGTLIKARVVVGENTKQKFIEETKVIPAIKVIEIVPRISQIRHTVKNGKVLVQGIVHKQIFFVGTDDLVHHLAEDIPFSDLVIVPCACEGMNSQDHSFVDNLVFEFDPVTGTLTQKIILVLSVKVTETCAVPVSVNECGILIKADQIIGFGCAQKLVEETKTLPAIKIVDIDARISEITSIVKNGKVIVQGVVHKQIFFVGADDLVHHVAEDLPFSEMIEVLPINPEFPVEEGMDQQDHSFIENIVWEFDPATGELTEKVIISIKVVVTNHIQIPVMVTGGCPGNDLWQNDKGCPDDTVK